MNSDNPTAISRKNVTGGNISRIGERIVYGLSKGQNIVCLCSTETEYIALSSLPQEIRFEQHLLDKIAGGLHKYPSIIFEEK